VIIVGELVNPQPETALLDRLSETSGVPKIGAVDLFCRAPPRRVALADPNNRDPVSPPDRNFEQPFAPSLFGRRPALLLAVAKALSATANRSEPQPGEYQIR
jgi:hypothetical protein